MMNKIKKGLIYTGIMIITSLLLSILWLVLLYQKDIIQFNIGNQLEEASIVRVVDGDTLIVLLQGEEERVRLIGIDTPESVHPDKEKNSDAGKVAYEYTQDLLQKDKKVYLEFEQSRTDYYGRLLAYVWLKENINPEKKKDIKENMVNAILLQEGYAIAHKYPPNVKNHQLFSELQKKAEKEKEGLWKEFPEDMKAITN